MNNLNKAQIQDKLKRGIGYNATPPPYNNSYIPPTTDLLERHVDEEMPKGSIEVDPLDEVAVEEDESESDETNLRNKQKQENIPRKKEKIKPSNYSRNT